LGQPEPAAFRLGQAASEGKPDPVPVGESRSPGEQLRFGRRDAGALVGDVNGQRVGGVAHRH
jgi:hypothetical protein